MSPPPRQAAGIAGEAPTRIVRFFHLECGDARFLLDGTEGRLLHDVE